MLTVCWVQTTVMKQKPEECCWDADRNCGCFLLSFLQDNSFQAAVDKVSTIIKLELDGELLGAWLLTEWVPADCWNWLLMIMWSFMSSGVPIDCWLLMIMWGFMSSGVPVDCWLLLLIMWGFMSSGVPVDCWLLTADDHVGLHVLRCPYWLLTAAVNHVELHVLRCPCWLLLMMMWGLMSTEIGLTHDRHCSTSWWCGT